MQTASATRRARLQAAIGGALVLVGLLVVLTAPRVSACSGVLVDYAEIRDEATRIVLGRVVGRDVTPDGTIERLAIEVTAVIRGSAPAELVLDPPTYMGCEGRIDEPIGAQLVIATGPQYFDAAPPGDLHPYWRVAADGTLDAVGVGQPDPRLRTLDGLAADVGGLLSPVQGDEPQAAGPADEGVRLPAIVAILALVAGLGVAVVLVAGRISSRRDS